MIYAARLIFAVLFLTGLVGTAHAADPLDAWLYDVSACTGSKDLNLAVIGIESDQTVLSREQADEARLYVEQRLEASGRVKLAPAADIIRIKALEEGTTGVTNAKVEEQIRKAFDGDAAVFFASLVRSGDTVTLRLQAITKSAQCKATSAPIDVPVRAAPGLSDVDQVMQQTVHNLMQRAPDAKSVEVCPFQSGAGYSACSVALADRLTIALDAEARSQTRILQQKPLDIRNASAGSCDPARADVIARGNFEHDDENRSWMGIEFQRAGNVIAPSGRIRIATEALGCDPTVRPFLDHIAATAKTDRSQLDMLAGATPFAVNQRLTIQIDIKKPMQLYCWVVAPDETAFVTLPVRSQNQLVPFQPSSKSYPLDFGLTDIVLSEKFENLFECFGVENGLPPALQTRWMAAAPSANDEAKLLQRDEVLDLLQQIRAVPGVVEATTRIVVR